MARLIRGVGGSKEGDSEFVFLSKDIQLDCHKVKEKGKEESKKE